MGSIADSPRRNTKRPTMGAVRLRPTKPTKRQKAWQTLSQTGGRGGGRMKKSSRWHITRLGELAKVERGRFSHRPRNDPSFYGGTTPFIQTGDVSGAKSGFIREFSQTLNSKGLSVSKVFPKGTLMVSIAANIGDAAELGFDSACPDSVIAITPGKALCSKYLRYYLRSRQSWIQYLAPVGTQRNINVEFLEDVEIEFPPSPSNARSLTSSPPGTRPSKPSTPSSPPRTVRNRRSCSNSSPAKPE